MPLAIITLLISVGLLLIGHGIQLTLLPLYAKSVGWQEGLISLTGATYFVGFMIGALTVPKILSKAGYIRVFLTLSALLAIVILSLGLVQNVVAWSCLRLLTGICIAGIYLTSESWVNAIAKPQKRGTLLAIYALVTLVGIGIGQTLVGLFNFDILFDVCAILMLLALVPVGIFCSDEPELPKYVKPKLSDMKGMPPLAIVAILMGGVMTGSIWSVAPLYGLTNGLDSWQISMMMNAIVLGGMCFQLPFGILFDRIPPRKIIMLVSAACCLTLLLVPSSFGQSWFWCTMFAFGGLSLTQYAIGSAYANGASELSRVKVASMVLLLNGSGSVLGPLLTGLASIYVADAMIVVSFVSMLVVFAAVLFYRDKPVKADVLLLSLPLMDKIPERIAA